MIDQPTVYKVLAEDGSPHHGGNGTWLLPQGDEPGEWMPPIDGELVPCNNGYHLCREQDLVHWLGPVIYQAEYRGEVVEHVDKIVVREARLVSRLETWNGRTARLFARDCAERVLHLYEREKPDDSRVRNCIEVARQYADGKATLDDLNAARDAAWAAAWDAAGAAARAAAGAAAWAAAGDAAGDAAGAAERKWQTTRHMQYLRGEAG